MAGDVFNYRRKQLQPVQQQIQQIESPLTEKAEGTVEIACEAN
jgi:hypothetical protein